MSTPVATEIAVLEGKLGLIDQVRGWIRRSGLILIGLYFIVFALRMAYFEPTHRLPLAVMLVLLGAAFMAIAVRILLALVRTRLTQRLQSLRAEILIHESRNPTPKP